MFIGMVCVWLKLVRMMEQHRDCSVKRDTDGIDLVLLCLLLHVVKLSLVE
jgi:hypothetical protein